MADELFNLTPSEIVSRMQSASIEIINARATGRTPNVAYVPKMEDVYPVNGNLIAGPHVTTKRERLAVASAMVELIDVADGKLPVPIERTPDIEPFFLP